MKTTKQLLHAGPFMALPRKHQLFQITYRKSYTCKFRHRGSLRISSNLKYRSSKKDLHKFGWWPLFVATFWLKPISGVSLKIIDFVHAAIGYYIQCFAFLFKET